MTFTGLLRAHPRSLVAHVSRGQGVYPLLNLVWLFWVLAVPWMLPLGWGAVLFTYLSLAIFLPLYALAWYDDRTRLPRYVAAIALLGLVSLPINTCWSYIVYASALVVFHGTVRAALAWLAALLVAFGAVAAVSPFFSIYGVLFGMATCLVVALFNLAFRANAQRDAELRLTQEEVRRLAATAERERIGRDLHDLLGATLSLIAIKSELAGRLLERDIGAARREVADIEAVARGALGQVRSAVAGIRAALLAGELASARLLLEAGGLTLHADIEALSLPADAESALALGLREAVTNVQRHAAASRVDILLRGENGEAVLTVQDDGRGGFSKAGHGLAGMEERLHALGGNLSIESLNRAEGGMRGTRLVLRLPLRPEAAHGPLPAGTAADALIRAHPASQRAQTA